MVTLHTTFGDIKLRMFADEAPATVENFLQYCRDGFYNGTLFHRVIDGFMVQGGGMASGMEEKPTRAPIKNEADNGLSNLTGRLAMARTMEPHSASSQFFYQRERQLVPGSQSQNARRLGLLCVCRSGGRHGRGQQN